MTDVNTVEIGNLVWRLADPFETQERTCTIVPSERGLYLWLRRSEPGFVPGATDDVLYVGRSKNLRARLHQYSSSDYTKEDAVLRSVFDRIIAPELDPLRLQSVVVDRLAPGLAQMWVRDHVVFAWTTWHEDGIGTAENRLRADLRPWFNSVKSSWTRYESPEHHHHDLTIPIEPRPDWFRAD